MDPTKHIPGPPVKDLREDGGELFSRIFNSLDDLPVTLRKRAHLMDEKAISAMSDSAFADPIDRKFLVNTPEHALTSFAYLAAQGVGAGDPRSDKARKMAGMFGIEGEILQLEKIIAARLSCHPPKTASTPKWSIVADAVIDGESRKVAVNGNSEESLMSVAAETMTTKFAQSNPPEIVSAIAEGVLKVATSRGWSLGGPSDVSGLMLLAGRACPDRELAEASIYSRSRFFPDRFRNTISGVARKMASVEEMPSRQELLKLAFHIGKIDRDLGLEKFYGSRIPDPLRSVFHHSEAYAKKVASRFLVGSGTEYSRYQVETPEFKTAALMVADLHGVDRSSVPEIPDHIPAWVPAEMESSFRKIASDLGVEPRQVNR